MLPCKQIDTFFYDAKDFNFAVKFHEKNGSPLDDRLEQKWKYAEKIKATRYVLNIKSGKTLKGKYRFLAQLNPDRSLNRRAPVSVMSMSQPFNPIGFNFTKLTQREILFDIGNGDTNDIIAINASPLEQFHCLLLTERLKCLPQVMTEYSLRKAVELCLLSNLWSLRIFFNSLCAHASVNHLHWHLYYLCNEMLLEYIDVRSYMFGIHLLIDYPAKGLCMKLSSFENISDFISLTFLVVNYLQSHQIAHNICITRAKSGPNDELYDDVRIYVWARKSLVGARSTIAFAPGVCEFFGHISIGDEDTYNNLKEDNMINVLNDVIYDFFLLMKDQLRYFLEKHAKESILRISRE